MPDQRSLLRGRLASVIDGVADVAAQLAPPAASPVAPPPPPAPPGRAWTLALAMEPIAAMPVVSAPAAASAAPSLPPSPDAALPYDPPSHHRFPPAVIIGTGLVGVVLAVVGGDRALTGGCAVRLGTASRIHCDLHSRGMLAPPVQPDGRWVTVSHTWFESNFALLGWVRA